MADDVGLRRRVPPRQEDTAAVETKETATTNDTEKKGSVEGRIATAVSPGSYWLTRIVFIRFLGFIYCESRD